MRKSGILMPIFSLPSAEAIGTLGKEAFSFVDFLCTAGQKIWQVLPLVPADYTNSPYQSVSCFAGESLYIDFELLCRDGLLKPEDVPKYTGATDKADYPLARQKSSLLLKKAFGNFNCSAFEPDYSDFLSKNRFWLYDYALYRSVKQCCGGAAWCDFPAPLRDRDPKSLKSFEVEHRTEIDYYTFEQFIFFRQWHALKSYANKNGIEILGDMPIYAAYDSADVWAHRNCFLLDGDGKPQFIAGTPPDAFSPEGQLWGSPLYDFNFMAACEKPYYWWVERMRHALYMYDSVRIDHFRGFESFFAIPSAEKTAENGQWIKGPDIDIFNTFKSEISRNLPIVAEDLGIITPAVRELLKKTGFAGMRVLQFAFDKNPDNPYLPYNYSKNTVAYISTHDNATLIGQLSSDKAFKDGLINYIGETNESINWAAVRLLMGSAADTVIFTMQDIMAVGNEGRINTPGTINGNWLWRMDASCPNSWLAGIIKKYTEKYGRA